MPYIKIWIHCVWNTKSKQPLLQKEIRRKIFEHIKEYSKIKNIFVDCINGSVEHVHCLISLGGEQNGKMIILQYPLVNQFCKESESIFIIKSLIIKKFLTKKS